MNAHPLDHRTRKTNWSDMGSRALVASFVFASIGGCADPAALQRPAEAVAPYLTEQVRSALDASGRFVVPQVAGDTLNASEGTELARAFVGALGMFLEPEWSHDAGVAVKAGNLIPCGNSLLARSIYDDTPISDSIVRYFAGPHWIVSFCERVSGAVVTVSVSALARQLVGMAPKDLPHNGRSGDFLPMAFAPGLLRMPIEPEGAAIEVAKRSGARVNSVPMLFERALPWVPARAVWRMRLERAVTLRGAKDQRPSSSNELYVGLNDGHTALVVMRPYLGGDENAFQPTMRMHASNGLRPRAGLHLQLEEVTEIRP